MILVNPDLRLWYTCPSLSLACLAAVVRQDGRPVHVVDFGLLRSPASVLRQRIEEEDNPIAGITANVATIRSALRIASFIRNISPATKIVMGGPHPSAIYDVLVPTYCDAVIVGEAEHVIGRVAEGRPFREIEGAVFWDGGLRVNPRKGYIEDIDSLPFPDWSGTPLTRYDSPGRMPALPLMTSRGCPFDCINCTKFIHGHRLRCRSPEHVIEEIQKGIADWGVREVQIWDDNFTLGLDHAKEICRQIIQSRLHRKVRFLIPSGIRADIYDEELFDLFAKANFYFVSVAVESGKQEVLDRIGKKLDLSKVDRTVRGLTGRGIRVALYFMMGFPFETLEDMDETIRFAQRLPAHHAHFFMVIPFPGTELYDMVRPHGEFVTDPAMGLPPYDEALSCFRVEQYTREQLASRLKRAYRSFYYRPNQILRTMKVLLRDPQDLKYLAKSAWRIVTKGRRV